MQQTADTPLKPRYNLKQRIDCSKNTRKKNGYIRLDQETLVLIGPVDSLQYKLIRSLFNPASSHTLRYQGVQQSIERTYSNMMGNNSFVHGLQDVEEAMDEALATVMTSIQKSDLGKYVTFSQTRSHVRMSILRGT